MVGVIGADGLRFLAYSEMVNTVLGLKNDGFMVPFLPKGLQIFLINKASEIKFITQS